MLRTILDDRRNRSYSLVKQALVLLACVSASTYFAYHGIFGRHGLETQRRLHDRASILEFEIKTLESVRAKLERDVALLSPELPNPDMVEEIARDVLGYANQADVLIAQP